MEDTKTRVRPLGFGEILDMAFRIYKKRFAPIFVLTLLIYGPFYFFREMLSWFIGLESLGTVTEQDVILETAWIIILLIFIFIALIMMFLWPLWMAAITGISAGTFLRNESFTWIDGLKLAGKYGLKSLLTFLTVFSLGLACGLFFLISLFFFIFLDEIVGPPDWIIGMMAIFLILFFTLFILIVSIRLSLLFPVILEEGIAYFECMKRSWELTKSSFWRIFGLLFILTIIEGIITGIPASINQVFMVSPVFQSTGVAIAFSLITTFFFCFTTPLQAITMSLVYIDRRARREGWDLEQKMAQLETTA